MKQHADLLIHSTKVYMEQNYTDRDLDYINLDCYPEDAWLHGTIIVQCNKAIALLFIVQVFDYC